MSNTQHLKLGWWLFVVSALLFAWSAIRAGSWIAAAGAGAFLLANISFMIPLYRGDRDTT
jgi:F0F1-type ATP synthase assembly protein I